MKIKKLLVLLLVFAMIFNFAACGNNAEPANEEPENVETGENEPENPEPVALKEEEKVPTIELWITSQTYDPVRYEAGLMMADSWKELGFDVNVTTMEWATMSAEGMKGHKHDAFMIQWGGKAERIDPFHWLYTLHYSEEGAEGGYNVAGYNNPKYDILAEEFATNMDTTVRIEKAAEMQKIVASDVPQPPIVHRMLTQVYNKDKYTNAIPAMGEGLYSFWNWINITPKTDDKVIKFGAVNDIKLLNPLTTKTGQDIYMLKLIYDSLVKVDTNGKIVPWLAESYNVIDDTTIEVTLRDDVKFHDGTPLTVEDVKFTFDFAKEVSSPYYLSKIKALESVEIIGDNQLRFKLANPFAPFISNGLALVGILPKHIWEKEYEERGAEGILSWENTPAIGSGPFIYDYWRPNEEFMLTANKEHFSAPKVDGILRIPFAQSYGILQSLKSGEIDITGQNMLPLDLEEIANDDFLQTIEIADQGCYMLHFNMRKAPFNDVHVRRALTFAIPKKAIVDVVFGGRALKAYSVVAEINKTWHNPEIEKIDYNMSEAKKELEEAGFRWDDSGKIYFPENYTPQEYLD